MDSQVIFIVCIVAVIALVTFAVSQWAVNKSDTRVRDRLRANEASPSAGPATSAAQSLGQVLTAIGQAAAKPFEPKSREKQSELRKKLARAGIYSPSAAKLVVGSRAICLGLGLFGGYALGAAMGNMALGLSVGGLVGYLLPSMWLKMQIKKHQRGLEFGLADALDLLVICVESGLTVDSAMQRVSQELTLAHPGLSKELEIAHMETRVGVSRSDALKNLGVRTGNASLQNLSSMLIQAERFGTSIANALRVQSDSLRVTRQTAAEEIAAKATVKLSFPVVLFIFPAVLIVLAGPAILGLFKSSLMN